VKLNEFKTLQELDLSNVIGSFGAAGAQQIGNRLMGRGEGQLSVKDKMAKNTYISNLVGRASTNLDSAIKSGLVNPNAKDVATSTVSTQGAVATAPAGETPEQKRIRLQKAAQQNIDKTAMPFSKVPAKQPATPASIRQQKQAAAADAAQQQMAPVSKLPPNQQAIAAGNVRQKQQAAAGAAAQQQAAPFSKVSPAPAVWKNNRNPNAPSQRRPVMKENEFFKLDEIFESILNVDEQVNTPQSISSYVQSFFKKYMKNVNLTRPDVQKQIKDIADEVQSTYTQDKGKQAFTKLANLGYALSYSDTGPATAGSPTTADTGGMLNAFAQGAGLRPGTNATNSVEKDSFSQVKDMIGKLDVAGKKEVLSKIDQELTGEPEEKAQPSAMGNMARQLAAKGQSQTSTGGATIATGTGVRHAASPLNPNQAPKIGDRIEQAKQSSRKRRTNNKAQQRALARKTTA
jgi:hypothetical protein